MKKLIVAATLVLFGVFTLNAQDNSASSQKKETTAVASKTVDKKDGKTSAACKHDGMDACCKAKAKAGKSCSASEMKSCCKHKSEAEASKAPAKEKEVEAVKTN